MALTKKEQAERAALQQEVRIARALRWTDEVKRDLPPPSKAGSVCQGWDFNRSGAHEAWSSTLYHGNGVYTDGNCARSREPCDLFSTEERALMAMRNTIERQSAEALAAIDARLEAMRAQQK